jgi:uncharacterized protein YqjF (DUF2071 family)
MLNYAIDPAILAPLVPRGVELDVWQGEALVSMVGFLFLDTRLLGVPVPFHRDFEEVNLRFYVRRKVEGEWRRGVTFVRELVPRPAIATTARLFYNEPYLALPMRHRIERRRYEYSWKFRDRWHSLVAEVTGDAAPMPAGSAEEFIFEHYWGYTRQRDGSTIEYRVEHPRWQVWQVVTCRIEAAVAAFYAAAICRSAQPRTALGFRGGRLAGGRHARGAPCPGYGGAGRLKGSFCSSQRLMASACPFSAAWTKSFFALSGILPGGADWERKTA